MGAEYGGEFAAHTVGEAAAAVKGPDEAGAGGGGLYGRRERGGVRTGAELPGLGRLAEEGFDGALLGAVHGQGVAVELRVGQVDAQERQMVRERLGGRRVLREGDEQRLQGGEGAVVALAGADGQVVRVARGLLGEREEQ
ncbi:hypothetical protein AB0J65_07440, partial [Streptomyces toxytricini]